MSTSRSRTAVYILCWLCLVADGYDLMAYGATLPSLIGHPPFDLTIAQGGHIASLALVGMLVGSLVAGTCTDRLGRRKIFLVSVTTFSTGMLLTAAAPTIEWFVIFRTLTGLGVGGLLPTAVALASEFTVGGRRSRTLGFVLTGPPTGMVVAALLSSWLVPEYGFRPVYGVGAIVLLIVPVLWKWMPESPDYLHVAGRIDEATAVRARYGLPQVPAAAQAREGAGGLRDLLGRSMRGPTVLIWATTFFSLLTAFGITTWLPQVMAKSGYGLGSSITFLLVYCIGAVIGTLVASRFADRMGPKRLVVTGYLVAACALMGIALLTPPTPVLVALVLLAGYGGLGTQNILNDFIARFYPSRSRASGLGWALGVGRIGAILGPTFGAWAIGMGTPLTATGFAFAVTALFGALVMAAIPRTARPTPSAQQTTDSIATVGGVDR